MIVTKRNGDEVPFEKSRISKAVHDAAISYGRNSMGANELGSEIANRVVERCVEWDDGNAIKVEDIQDLVEEELFSSSHPDIARSYIVYRGNKTKLRNAKPDIHAIQDYIIASKYANDETWDECIDRTVEMHLKRFCSDDGMASVHLTSQIVHAFRFVREKRVLPSMRSLQFAGPAIAKHEARIYNCSFSFIDRTEFWPQAFYLLLCGCGVGFSVQKHHIAKLPQVENPKPEDMFHFEVEDTIIGWAEALKALLNSYFNGRCYQEFNYTKIRTKGADLHTTGGKAPGHLPLKRMLERVRKLLDSCVGRKLTPFEAHRLTCFVMESVLAGGIRRSSGLSLFSIDDYEMRYCKTGDWMDKYPELAMSNNSAMCVRAETKKEDFISLFSSMKEYGEPGFFFSDSTEVGTNPCGEIGLDPVFEHPDAPENTYGNAANRPYDLVHETGFAFCNLTEINGALIKDQEDFNGCCTIAAFIGTLQAAYTNFHPILGEVTSKIASRDALLGVSVTGICDIKPKIDFTQGVVRVTEENARVANLLRINRAARATCVKPSGTASLVLGAVGSGIHPHHAKRYLRRVTANPLELAFMRFQSVNPHMCESKPNGDWVITFPIEADGLTRHDLSTIGFLEAIKDMFWAWVKPGYERGEASHNISATVSVKDYEWDEVAEWCWFNGGSIAAMSFLSEIGDRVYPFAPRYEVITAADQAEWIDLCTRYTPVDYVGVTRSDVGSACEGPKCEVE